MATTGLTSVVKEPGWAAKLLAAPFVLTIKAGRFVFYDAPKAFAIGTYRAFVKTSYRPDIEGAAADLARISEKAKKYPELSEFRNMDARTLDRTIAHHHLEEGKGLVPSMKAALFNLQETAGVDIDKIGSKIMPKDIAKTAEKAASYKAGIFERAASKPFRIIAHHPRLAASAAAIGAFVGITGWLRDRDVQRTQDAMMNDMTMAQQAQNAAITSQYMNSVSPQEMALLNARMRGSEGARDGFAANVQTARAAGLNQ